MCGSLLGYEAWSYRSVRDYLSMGPGFLKKSTSMVFAAFFKVGFQPKQTIHTCKCGAKILYCFFCLAAGWLAVWFGHCWACTIWFWS